MKITADTNVLARAVTGDDARQSRIAQETLAAAEYVALPMAALCELVWVLARGYRIALPDIAETIRRLTGAANVAVNRQAVEAGLAMLEDGGDFADGVIAFEGAWLGGDQFVSFDQTAVKLMAARGQRATLLGTAKL